MLTRRAILVGSMAAVLSVPGSYASDQAILGRELLVRDGLAANRLLVGRGQRTAGSTTVVGDPVLAGAAVTFVANGATGSQQTFQLPPGADPPGPAPGWKAVNGGFKYTDVLGQNGPVSRALIQRATNGMFVVKVTARGAGITVVPPDPGTDGSMIFDIPGGNRYCVNLGGAAGGTIKANALTSFKVVGAVNETTCPPPPPPPPPVKRVFVADLRSNGNLGGLAGADAICNSRASAAGLTGTFMAWLADDTGSPSTRFTHATGPYVRTDGQVIANDWADLTDGMLAVPIVLDENGQAIPHVSVWSNVTTAGTARSPDFGQHCDRWSSSDAGFGGRLGDDVTVDFAWTDAFQLPVGCNNPFGFGIYCFEQ